MLTPSAETDLCNLLVARWARRAQPASATRRCPLVLVPTAVRALVLAAVALAQHLTAVQVVLAAAMGAVAAVAAQATAQQAVLGVTVAQAPQAL